MNTINVDALHQNYKRAPRIELSEDQSKQWDGIHRAMREYSESDRQKPLVLRVVRAFKKTDDELKRWIQKVEKEDATLESGGTILSIPLDDDVKGGEARTALNFQKVLSEDAPQRPFASVGVRHAEDEKFWTSAMNGPTAMIAQMAKELSIDPEKIIIYFSSFETRTENDQLERAKEMLDENQIPLFVRKTPAKHLYGGEGTETLDAQYIQDNIKRLVDYITYLVRDIIPKVDRLSEAKDRWEDSKLFLTETGLKKLLSEFACIGRATNGFVRLSELIKVGGFDPSRNKSGGMEDHEEFIQEMLAAVRDGKDVSKLILEKFKKNILEYTDTRVTEETQPNNDKIVAEINAIYSLIIQLIVEPGVRTAVPSDRRDFVIPENT